MTIEEAYAALMHRRSLEHSLISSAPEGGAAGPQPHGDTPPASAATTRHHPGALLPTAGEAQHHHRSPASSLPRRRIPRDLSSLSAESAASPEVHAVFERVAAGAVDVAKAIDRLAGLSPPWGRGNPDTTATTTTTAGEAPTSPEATPSSASLLSTTSPAASAALQLETLQFRHALRRRRSPDGVSPYGTTATTPTPQQPRRRGGGGGGGSRSPERDEVASRMLRHAEGVAMSEAAHAVDHSALVSRCFERVKVMRRFMRRWRDACRLAQFAARTTMRRAVAHWRRAAALRCHRRYVSEQRHRAADPRWSEAPRSGSKPQRPAVGWRRSQRSGQPAVAPQAPRQKAMVRDVATEWRRDHNGVQYRVACDEVQSALQAAGAGQGTTPPPGPPPPGLVSPATPFPATASASRHRRCSASPSLASSAEYGSPSPRAVHQLPAPYLYRSSGGGGAGDGSSSGGATGVRHAGGVPRYGEEEEAEEEGVEALYRGGGGGGGDAPSITECMRKNYSIAACSAFVSVMEAKVKHSALLRWKARAAHRRRRHTIQQV